MPQTTYYARESPGVDKDDAVPMTSPDDAGYLSRLGWFVTAETRGER